MRCVVNQDGSRQSTPTAGPIPTWPPRTSRPQQRPTDPPYRASGIAPDGIGRVRRCWRSNSASNASFRYIPPHTGATPKQSPTSRPGSRPPSSHPTPDNCSRSWEDWKHVPGPTGCGSKSARRHQTRKSIEAQATGKAAGPIRDASSDCRESVGQPVRRVYFCHRRLPIDWTLFEVPGAPHPGLDKTRKCGRPPLR